ARTPALRRVVGRADRAVGRRALGHLRCRARAVRRVLCFFFFQAEDGIRDRNVTGVQTCALPISTKRGACGVPRRVLRTRKWRRARASRRRVEMSLPTGVRFAFSVFAIAYLPVFPTLRRTCSPA